MLKRIVARLRYLSYSILLLSILFLFSEENRINGIGGIFLSIGIFIFSNWYLNRPNPEDEYEADENGNAKPKYR